MFTFGFLKKIILIALIISYGLSSFGVSLNYFYCCGKLKSVSLKAQTNPNCSPKKKKGCCENKKLSLKLNIDQKSEQTKSIAVDIPVKAIPETGYAFLQHEMLTGIIPGKRNLTKDPPLPTRKKNLLHCVFRI